MLNRGISGVKLDPFFVVGYFGLIYPLVISRSSDYDSRPTYV